MFCIVFPSVFYFVAVSVETSKMVRLQHIEKESKQLNTNANSDTRKFEIGSSHELWMFCLCAGMMYIHLTDTHHKRTDDQSPLSKDKWCVMGWKMMMHRDNVTSRGSVDSTLYVEWWHLSVFLCKKATWLFPMPCLVFLSLKELRLFSRLFCSSFFLLSTEGHVNTSIDTRNQLDDCDLIVGKFTKKPSTPSTSVMFLLSQDPQMKQFTFGWVDHGHCGQQGKKFQGHGWKSHQDFDAAVMKEGKMCFLFRGWKVGEGWAGATCHWHLLLSDGHRWC